MKRFISRKMKIGLIACAAVITLTACGGSTEEEQLQWLSSWNSTLNYEAKMKMVNVCFKKAGIKSLTKAMSEQQSQIYNDCEVAYIVDMADVDDISLDEVLVKKNILQF